MTDESHAPLKIALSTIGKFHSFDLARQLHRRSALTAIFTGYPRFKLKNEKLPDPLIHTFPWLHVTAVRFPRGLLGERAASAWESIDQRAFDLYTSWRLPECDIFCGMSGSALATGLEAQRRGAKFVCDRGSSHIRFQDRILREEYARAGILFPGIHPRVIERETAEYETADLITVPSRFAYASFLAEKVPESKLRLVPYGVDLSKFQPVGRPEPDGFDVLFVGTLGIRKGVPYLLEAFSKLQHPRKRLFFIGSLLPELRPLMRRTLASTTNIHVLGHVPQLRLREYMSRAHVMVLPSVEEGLATVQAQALACGCPVIATTNTGAHDLFSDGTEGFIVPPRDTDALTQAMQRLADDRALRDRMRALARRKVESIGGWDLYGDTMYDVFRQISATSRT